MSATSPPAKSVATYPIHARDHTPACAVIVMGQTPPPVNGQSLMIEEFLAGTYPGFKLIHIPMRFSEATSEIGVAGFGKVRKLIEIVANVYRVQRRTKATVLYYPPAGPNLVPLLRDIVILGLCRRWFSKTVFHFHAAGLADILPRLLWPLRRLFHVAYDHPDLAIFTTDATSREAEVLHAKAKIVVPCGTRDHSHDLSQEAVERSPVVTILFAGILCEGKGLKTLLSACALLHERGIAFRLSAIGSFESQAFQAEVAAVIEAAGIGSFVEFPGTVTGEAKTRQFQSADIFCFPSHYTSESFGVVLIEAMSFSLPIIATRWRGIPEVVGVGVGLGVCAERSAESISEGSFLVDIQAPDQLAERLSQLIESEALRHTMGAMNRARYHERFTIEAYRAGMLRALDMLT